jgi:hypothetical protein
MRTVTACFRSGVGVPLASLLLITLLQGCVTVDTKCGGCCDGGGGSGKPTGCNKVTLPPFWTVAGSTTYFTNNSPVPTTQGYKCVSGTRCAGSPGKCVIGGPNCKTWFTPVAQGSKDGNCNCDCP